MEKGAKVKVLAFGGAKQRLVKIICRCGCGTPFVEGKGVKVGRRWFVDLEHSRTFNQQLYQRKKASALRDRRPRLEPRQARIAPPEPETMWEFVDAFVRARDEQTDRELGKLKDAPA